MKVAVIGTGYVGLVAATCFAEVGNNIVCVDIDENKIEGLKKGVIPIYEPGLEELVVGNMRHGRLYFTTDIRYAVENCEVIFIAVGTPSSKDGSADLQYVLKVADSIGEFINGYKVVVNKSTVPVGTADKVRAKLKESMAKHATDQRFSVVSNPEFMKEGAALDDFMRPDRVIIGVDDECACEIIKALYFPFTRKQNNIITMDVKSAEITKYAANAMLATRISFMNEIANLCDKVGADVSAVRKGMGSDRRIGYDFLYPGIGYGGSCFPKDVRALINTGGENETPMSLINAVDAVNDRQKSIMLDKLLQHYGVARETGSIAGKTFAVWGLAFKANTDDVRESGAISTAKALVELGAKVVAYDPQANEQAKKILADSITYVDNMYSATEGADALLIATEWNEFKLPDFKRLATNLADKIVFDGRNLYSADSLLSQGLSYYTVGRGTFKV